MNAPNLNVRLGRLSLSNPVMVASGTFGFGREYEDLVEINALGALVTKGVSLQPRKGNLPPRIAETPCGMLNAVGIENPGFDRFAKEKMPWLRKVKPAVIVNVYGSSLEEFSEIAGLIDQLEGVDALEVNISCPNVSKGGIAFGADPDMAYEVSSRVREKTDKAVIVKLSPNVTDIVQIASRVAEAGVDGLTLINTLRGMAIDYRTRRPLLANVIGGLSGPAIRPVAVRAVFEVCQALDIPVIGCGGITNWTDALEFFIVGACAIQVGSATFRSPSCATDVLKGITNYLIESGRSSISELVGTVEID
jgi:dihydroorotate dehydrogenase (NAD+) catalytic subunit